MVSALEPASFGAGASSTSSCIPPAGVADAFESERTTALWQTIRGMEAELVDLVCHCSSAGQFMDWLRVPLEFSVATGNLAVVKRLLAAGVKTETPPERLQPAPLLHLAAESGSEGIVEELLKAGVDVHEKDSTRHDQTALHCAATAGSGAAVRALTGAGADVDVLDAMGRTPLYLACMKGHRGVVVFLLLKGACAQKLFGDEFSYLHLAAIKNHPGVIEDLLSFGNVSIGCSDARGRSALHVAAEECGVEACLALLRGGAAVDRTCSDGLTCLDGAALRGHAGQLLQILTTAEATDDRKRMCSNALYYAVYANKPDTIRDLVALGADMEYRRKDTFLALHATAVDVDGGDLAAEALLRAGANTEARDGGRTPLHFACSYSRGRIVHLLLYWGADENATDSDGKFPSELVGIDAPIPDEVLLPEENAKSRLMNVCIRCMLETAPADRSWRRRGWVVICRARWLARIGEQEKCSSTPLECIPDGATGAKKRRGKIPGSALVGKLRDFPLDKGKAHGRTKGGGRHLPKATAEATAAVVLRLGTCSVLSDGDAGQAAGVARLAGRTRFVAVMEQLLLLREDSIFREVVTFL